MLDLVKNMQNLQKAIFNKEGGGRECDERGDEDSVWSCPETNVIMPSCPVPKTGRVPPQPADDPQTRRYTRGSKVW